MAYCNNCGRPHLAQMTYCSNCGNLLQAHIPYKPHIITYCIIIITLLCITGVVLNAINVLPLYMTQIAIGIGAVLAGIGAGLTLIEKLFHVSLPKANVSRTVWVSIATVVLLTILLSCTLLHPFSVSPIARGAHVDATATAQRGVSCPPIAKRFPLPSGAISYWQGEGNANDTIGVNNGTLNGVTFDCGKFGQAFSFDRNNFVASPATGLPTGNNNRTIELWVKLRLLSTQESFFVGYGDFGHPEQVYDIGTKMDGDTSTVLFFSQWNTDIEATSPVKAGIWYHVAVTNDGNNVSLYLNGDLVASGVLKIETSAGSKFYIGRALGDYGNIRALDGLIDEVVVYNRVLSRTEILNRARSV